MKNLLLLTDFYPDTLKKILVKESKQDNQVWNIIAHWPVRSALWNSSVVQPDTYSGALIFQRAETISPSFSDALQNRNYSRDDVIREIELFCDQIKNVKRHIPEIFLFTFCKPHFHNSFGLLDFDAEFGISSLIVEMNKVLVDQLSTIGGIYIQDSSSLESSREAVGSTPWFTSKQLYPLDALKSFSRNFIDSYSSIRGNARKMIVCDLDDTLWGGTVGEDGWENLKIGGHDPVGEAFYSVQQSLKALEARGLILCIVSKNNESVALEAIRRHPEMLLSLDDFVGWRINWSEKHANILQLCEELKISPSHTVFIDDNPVERDKVRQKLPDVLTIELSSTPFDYADQIRTLNCFDTATFSNEDRNRTSFYKADEIRRRAVASSKGDGNKTTKLYFPSIVRPQRLDQSNSARAHQLLNKTNQLNLRTRRMTLDELITWSREPLQSIWTYRVSDKFGDNGLTAIASFRAQGETCFIEDFLLSCRVIGRGIEEAITYHIIEQSKKQGAQKVRFHLVPTERNQPCLAYLEGSTLRKVDDETYEWHSGDLFECPQEISIEESI